MTFVTDINGRRFAATIADSKAKRVWNNKLNRYEMSDIATITEAPTNTEWQHSPGVIRDKFTALSVVHDCKLYGRYTTNYLNQAGIDRVREFLAHNKPFTKTVIRGVYISCEPKDHYRNKFTGTGSKDAAQAPIWGYRLVKTPAKTQLNRVEYQGIQFDQPLPNRYGNRNTPCAPTLIEVTKFLPCGLADQKLLFGARHSKRYMKKQSALDLLFVPRPLRPCEQVAKALSLSTNENDEVNTTWIPTTQNPIDEMANNEQYAIRQRDARLELARIKQLIGDKRFELLVLSAEGMNAREIAEKTGGSYEAIKKNLQRIKKQLTEAQQ
jgi:hypothetical protein